MFKLDWVGVGVEVVNVLLLISWLALIVVALISLRNRRMEPIVEVLWTLFVVLVPMLGPLALFIVAPGASED